MKNDPAALLCLDHFFSSPLELRNLLLDEIETSLYLYLDYVYLLNQVRRDGSLARGSARQRLFGFQVLGGNRYMVPGSSSVHKKLAKKSGSSGKSTDEYKCDSDELGRSITNFISNRTLDRTKVQNDTCRGVHGFSPCLQLLVRKKCSPPEGRPCTFQHVQPEELTPDWYHARLHLILLQFQILDLARYDDLDVKKYVPVHSVGNARGYSLEAKLLAWGVALSASSTFPEAWVAGESRHRQHTRWSSWFESCARMGSIRLL